MISRSAITAFVADGVPSWHAAGRVGLRRGAVALALRKCRPARSTARGRAGATARRCGRPEAQRLVEVMVT